MPRYAACPTTLAASKLVPLSTPPEFENARDLAQQAQKASALRLWFGLSTTRQIAENCRRGAHVAAGLSDRTFVFVAFRLDGPQPLGEIRDVGTAVPL